MSHTFPVLCVVDTNIPINANLAKDPESIPGELIFCVYNCILAIDHVIKNRSLVIDSGDEIYNEYRNKLSLSGQPGTGDKFMKWVHDNRWMFVKENRVSISPDGDDSYIEFPGHQGLDNFDISDRKFVAVSNGHPKKPVILQSTDSKWWGWKEALAEVGIKVQFLCPEYAEKKYKEKILN